MSGNGYNIVGVDAGNNEIKVYGEHGWFKFDSCLSAYHDLKLNDKSAYDEDEYIIWEHNDERGFGGLLALTEGKPKRKRGGDTKAHPDLLLRVLIALHRYAAKYKVDTKFKIVVGQPIERHVDEDLAWMKEMLKGKHKLSVNGDFREINIQDVRVAPEGSAAFWANPTDGKIRILDFGSGTVNAATFKDRRNIDIESFTVNSGIKREGLDPDAKVDPATLPSLVSLVVAECVNHDWKLDDDVRVVGGAAKLALPLLKAEMTNAKAFQPSIKNGDSSEIFEPVYANAIGLYNLARGVFA